MTPLHSDMHSTNIGLKSHDNNDPQLCTENLGRRPRCPPIHAIAGNNQFILEKGEDSVQLQSCVWRIICSDWVLMTDANNLL